MFKKICSYGLLFALAMFIMSNSVNAQANKQLILDGKVVSSDEFKKSLCNSSVGKISFEQPLSVDGVAVELYCTFENKSEALEKLNSKYRDAIQLLQKNFNLSDNITDKNWNEFRNAINLIYEKNINITDEIAYQLSKINSFFDIYENDEINNEIESLVNKYNNISKLRTFNSPSDKINILNRIDEIIPDYSTDF